jgi:hypothetical protein
MNNKNFISMLKVFVIGIVLLVVLWCVENLIFRNKDDDEIDKIEEPFLGLESCFDCALRLGVVVVIAFVIITAARKYKEERKMNKIPAPANTQSKTPPKTVVHAGASQKNYIKMLNNQASKISSAFKYYS